MPVNWNAETEAKLLSGLFKVCDIRVNGEQLKELAAIIGPDCTPKAVTHRLAKFRTQAGAFNGGSKGKNGETIPAKKRSRASPKKTPGSGKAGKFVDEDNDDDEMEDYGLNSSAKKIKTEEEIMKDEDDEEEFVFKEE